MQKKLLVLAAGILQVPVIKKAKEMGIYVIAADCDANAVGLQYADKAVVVNITSEEEMLCVAREEQIDGVIHSCSEVSMSVMGRINDELGLSGITKKQAIQSTNKNLMREAFEKGGAPSPKSMCFENAEVALAAFYKDFKCDCILKPSRNSGSRGVAKISSNVNIDEFVRLFEIAKVNSRDHTVMLEQFIDGPEFSIEIIVWDSNVNVLTVTDKKTTGAPHFVELGHSQPSCFFESDIDKLKAAAVAGVKALGVNNCACHAEAKLMNGKVFLMEIGARLGGDFISTELTHISTGIDMVAAAINCALGVKPCLEPSAKKRSVCIRYFCPKPGKLIAISNTEILNATYVYQWDIYCKEGDLIPKLTSSLCRSGHVIVTDETPQRAIEQAEKLIKNVKFEIA